VVDARLSWRLRPVKEALATSSDSGTPLLTCRSRSNG
jgi:hypothetical protein